MLNMKTIAANMLILAVCFLPGLNVYAGTINPAMGDTPGRYMPIIIAVAAVALVAVIVIAVTSKKK